MIQKIEYQGEGVYDGKKVIIFSEDIGGLTLIGHFVRTELIQKIEEDEDAS